MKKIALVIFGTALLMTFVSCGSKPKNEDETPPAAPETVETEETLPDPEPEESIKTPELIPEPVETDDEADKLARAAAKAAYETALASKSKIDDWELAEYDQTRYDEANALLAELEAMLKDDSIKGADLEEKAKEINGKYNTVLLIGFKKRAREWRDEAYNSKKLADSVKAGVAEKTRYNKAVSDFKEGDTLYAMQAAEKACNRYIDADDEFTALFEELTEKRAAALAAIEKAKQQIAEVEALAMEADITDPVTDETEGIEAEDAVLLEEETYANPEEAVVDVPETMNEAVIEKATDAIDSLNKFVGGDK